MQYIRPLLILQILILMTFGLTSMSSEHARINPLQHDQLSTVQTQLIDYQNATLDPGWVAFNLGCIAYQEQNYRQAMLYFQQCLEDEKIPKSRQVAAGLNWSICAIRIGTIDSYRSAIFALEKLIQIPLTDSIHSDVKYHLELAKMLWYDLASIVPNPSLPNDPPPNVPPSIQEWNFPAETAENGERLSVPTPTPENANPTKAGAPQNGSNEPSTNRLQAGRGALPVNLDAELLPEMNATEFDLFIQQTAERLRKQRRVVTRLAAPTEKANVKNW